MRLKLRRIIVAFMALALLSGMNAFPVMADSLDAETLTESETQYILQEKIQNPEESVESPEASKEEPTDLGNADTQFSDPESITSEEQSVEPDQQTEEVQTMAETPEKVSETEIPEDTETAEKPKADAAAEIPEKDPEDQSGQEAETETETETEAKAETETETGTEIEAETETETETGAETETETEAEAETEEEDAELQLQATANVNGFKKFNGQWVWYRNGVIQSKLTGLVKGTINGKTAWYYIVRGTFQEATGITRKASGSDTRWYYVRNGRFNTSTGMVKGTINGTTAWYYIRKGVYTKNTGFTKKISYYGDSKWYFVRQGRYNASTGMVKGTINGVTAWFYIRSGVYTAATGLTKKISTYSDRKWYYIRNGRFTASTGITKKITGNDNRSFYVKKGKFYSYTGTVTVSGKKYNLINGVVQQKAPEAVRVTFTRNLGGGEEFAEIRGYSKDNALVWMITTGKYSLGQLDAVSEIGIYNGKYYYVENGSVVAVSLKTGKKLWTNSDFKGRQPAFAFDSKGYLYLSGYLGPLLFVVDGNGNTLARETFDGVYSWFYKITVNGSRGITIYYDYPNHNYITLPPIG